MKVRIQGPSATVIELADGTEILYSYETPVAAFVPLAGYVRTERKWSMTTGKHIAQYCGHVPRVPQEALDALAASVSAPAEARGAIVALVARQEVRS